MSTRKEVAINLLLREKVLRMPAPRPSDYSRKIGCTMGTIWLDSRLDHGQIELCSNATDHSGGPGGNEEIIAMRRTILILALALPAWAAQAQNVYYQSVMPDGRVVFGNQPEAGAKEVKQVPMRAGNISVPLSNPAQESGSGAIPRQQALDTADAGVREAEQALQSAKAALEAGREPQSGERIGTAGGASRLTDAYSQRIKMLEDNVTNAQKQLDQALSQRNSAR